MTRPEGSDSRLFIIRTRKNRPLGIAAKGKEERRHIRPSDLHAAAAGAALRGAPLPAVQLLPRSSATLAGEAGWLSALAALPVYLLLCWLVLRLLGRFPEGTGLAEAFQRTLGAPRGRG